MAIQKNGDSMENIEELFSNKKKNDILTYENIVKEFEKQLTLAQTKKIDKLSKTYGVKIISSSEYAKILTAKKQKKKRNK